MSDRLAQAFENQKRLQAAIVSGFESLMGNDSVAEALAHDYLVGLVMETAEGMKALRMLPAWDRHQSNLEALRGEVVDQFHHVINLALLLWRGDSETFFAAYLEKWGRNMQRAAERGQREKPYPYKR